MTDHLFCDRRSDPDHMWKQWSAIRSRSWSGASEKCDRRSDRDRRSLDHFGPQKGAILHTKIIKNIYFFIFLKMYHAWEREFVFLYCNMSGKKISHINFPIYLRKMVKKACKRDRKKWSGRSKDHSKTDRRSDHRLIGSLELKVIADQIKNDRPIMFWSVPIPIVTSLLINSFY